MQKEIRISAKDLGALAMPDFCPRCFWLKRKVQKLPFQIFPGIFSSIDSYSKKIVHAWFDMASTPPPFIPALKDTVKYLKAPHWSKFYRKDEVTGIVVSGVVDDLLEYDNGDHCIPDYKTAKYTENQDKLIPMYAVQLNGYAWIDEGSGKTVRSLPLIYCEPVTDPETWKDRFNTGGFDMGFSVKSIQIEKNTDMIPRLLKKADLILGMVEPPTRFEGCKDCEAIDGIMDLMGPWSAAA